MYENQIFSVSFHCFFPDGGVCKHTQSLPLGDISLWIDCYQFTHPNCTAISMKIWFTDDDV